MIWTALVQWIDVQPVGPNETNIGFASLNCWFHQLTGVHMTVYTVTDWLSLVPLLICVVFGGIGLVQLIQRRSLFQVDLDLTILGIYYVLVMFAYFIFEMIPVNYRPVLIDGRIEASYPSSTTLLVLCVMPTLNFQVKRRMKSRRMIHAINTLSILFAGFMVTGRMISGVHWLTDIIGAGILSAGLYLIYKSSVLLLEKISTHRRGSLEFGEKLQELRKSRGLTQQELAEALYVSRTAISKWESGVSQS